MSSRIELSIVICTYNRGTSLGETLQSLDQCRLPPDVGVEIVVINNNSSDHTEQVCARFATGSQLSFRYVTEIRQGLSHARNRGIAEAEGNFIIFTDDDVLVDRDWMVCYAEEFLEQRVDCAFGRVYPDWRGTVPDWFSPSLRAAYALLDYGNERLSVTDVSREFFGANFAVRKSMLQDIGGFDVNLGRNESRLFIGEETRVFLELLDRNANIVYDPRIIVHHVIEESRKQKAYLERYYHDTAESLVYASLRGQPSRRFCGIPLYRVREFMNFYVSALPQYLRHVIRGDRNALFAHTLRWKRNNRMLRLFLREWRRASAEQA